jgi:hypothetical protein
LIKPLAKLALPECVFMTNPKLKGEELQLELGSRKGYKF